MKTRAFRLSEKYLEPYKNQSVPWGGTGMGYVVFKRTYARRLDDNNPDAGTEEWWQTCRRVIEGMFDMQKTHCATTGLPWNDAKSQKTAKIAYDRLFNLKWTPPGRGLWMMGTDFVRNKTGAGLFNCAFRSTQDLESKGGYLFQWMMDALMVGIGVGFDTLGAGSVLIVEPGSYQSYPEALLSAENEYIYEDEQWICKISDTREGWVESVRILLNAFYYGYQLPVFSYDAIRPKGSLIKGFGGIASGYGPLEELHQYLTSMYQEAIGEYITTAHIVDTQNVIGRCVVAGNVRRSAALAMGTVDDKVFMKLKDPTEVHEMEGRLYDPDSNLSKEEKAELTQSIANLALLHHLWGSNKSVKVSCVTDYTELAELTVKNGEPGYIWLENARTRGRFKDPVRLDDVKVMGFNPCVEQQLQDGELCCLVETYPWLHETYEDYLITLKIAYLYAKTVTLAKTQWPETNQIMLMNRRIGLSMLSLIHI